jgi:predicted DNA-binding transcriptional regulator YafY
LTTTQSASLRYLAILECIPKFPHKIATPNLLDKLIDRGHDNDIRTLQRDLVRLVKTKPIVCYDEEKPYRYGYVKGALIPNTGMNTQTALALTLAQDHLKKIMPQAALDLLNNKFIEAEQHIESQEKNSLAQWKNRVCAIPNGKALIPAEIKDDVWRNVSEALINKKQLLVTYRKPNGELKKWYLHPQGIASRYSANYLIVTINDHEDLRFLALHRIQNAQELDSLCNQLDEKIIRDYMNSGELGWAYSSKNTDNQFVEEEVTLIADVSPYTASILSETKLTEQQVLEPIESSDWQRLTAIVPNNQETLWWIYSLNCNIHVHKPIVWVEEIKENLKVVQGMYEATI